MAIKVSVTASKNGGSSETRDVFMRNTEPVDFGPLFTYRLWLAFEMTSADTINATAVSIASGVNDPIGGFEDPDWYRQISLAFIES